eukprot:maker-scaffold1351_size46012-snap-gene-0.15 protein:Tk06402 transcript:maker-scaffold1351_size46012-snap-gene-0.15-mRNA-1 annotation:"hypothetical protein"
MQFQHQDTWVFLCLIGWLNAITVRACINQGGVGGGGRASQEMRQRQSGPGYVSEENRPQRGQQIIAQIHQLNQAEDLISVAKIPAIRGEPLYGRITIPWERAGWSLTIRAQWEAQLFTTPLWMYLKYAALPTQSIWDQTSISYVSRRYSQTRVEDVQSGSYYLLVEPLLNVRNLTLIVSLLPNEEDMRTPDFLATGASLPNDPR